MSRTRAIAPLAALFLIGVLLWALMGNDPISPAWRWLVVIACAAAACVPPVPRWAAAAARSLRTPSPRAAEWTALLVGVIAASYFISTAIYQDRDLFPKTHDEGSYLLAAQMLAKGRLWMPQ